MPNGIEENLFINKNTLCAMERGICRIAEQVVTLRLHGASVSKDLYGFL